jgi:hypothetical protein
MLASACLVEVPGEGRDRLAGEAGVVERPADEVGVVVPAAAEALGADALLPVGEQGLPRPAPGVVIPVHGADEGQAGLGEQERPAVEVVEAVLGAEARQVLAVDPQRVAARVVGADPDVVVAGDEGLAAGQPGEERQAAGEVVPRADVAGQDEDVRRVGVQRGRQQPGGGVAVGVDAPVQVGGESQAHGSVLQPRAA